MRIKSVEVPDFKALHNLRINFSKDFVPETFILAGIGKSTLLQLIFFSLHYQQNLYTLPSNLAKTFFRHFVENCELSSGTYLLCKITFHGDDKWYSVFLDLETTKNFKIRVDTSLTSMELLKLRQKLYFSCQSTEYFSSAMYSFLSCKKGQVLLHGAFLKNYIQAQELDFNDFAEPFGFITQIKECDFIVRDLFDEKSKKYSLDFYSTRLQKSLKFSQLSLGEKVIIEFKLWLNKIKPDSESILLLDSPELGLHPEMQYELTNIISESKSQVIIATNSYEMCEPLTPSHVISF